MPKHLQSAGSRSKSLPVQLNGYLSGKSLRKAGQAPENTDFKRRNINGMVCIHFKLPG